MAVWMSGFLTLLMCAGILLSACLDLFEIW